MDGSQTGCDRVWCADVVVHHLGSGVDGAFYFPTGNLGSLSNRSFSLGRNYAVKELLERGTGQLEIQFYQTPQSELISKTRLRVGTSAFKLSEGALNASENRITWTGTGVTWSDGDTVRVYLEDDVLLGNFLWPAAADHTDGGTVGQKFTVGSGANGYVLREVRLPTKASSRSDVRAHIFADASDADTNLLGAKLRELTRPATFSAGSVATATFSAGDLVLDGGSSYWLVWEGELVGGSADIGITAHAGTHRRGGSGWEISGALQALNAVLGLTEYDDYSTPRYMRLELVGDETTNNPPSGKPTITGWAQVGQTLTAVVTGISDADGPSSPTFSYQWTRSGSGESRDDIPGATASNYNVQAADRSQTLAVKVSFTDGAGNSETVASYHTGPAGSLVSTIEYPDQHLYYFAPIQISAEIHHGQPCWRIYPGVGAAPNGCGRRDAPGLHLFRQLRGAGFQPACPDQSGERR